MADEFVIDKLNRAQEAKIPEYEKEYVRRGLCTDPIDRAKAEQSIDKAYTMAGFTPPARKFYARGPLDGIIFGMYCYLICEGSNPNPNKSLRKSVEARAKKAGMDPWDWLMEVQVREDVARALAGNESHKRGHVNFRGVSDKQWELARAHAVENIFYGQHTVAWVSYYAFALYEIPEARSRVEKLEGLIEMTECGWWWAYEDFAVYCDRPEIISQDDRQNYHSDTGPCIRFRDGFERYAVHNVRVEPRVINNPKSLDPRSDILAEENVEVRRVMIEKYGQEEFIVDAGGKRLNTDDWGELWKVDLPNDEPIVMVKVVNSSPERDGSFKDYWLRVPPDTKTAHQGVAWMAWEDDPKRYAPEIET